MTDLKPSAKWPVEPANVFRSTQYLGYFVSLVLLACLFRKAWLDVDFGWDNLYYHIAFAGRRAGVIAAGSYEFGSELEQRYIGFPTAHDYIKGWFWRVTGEVNAVNLLNPLVIAICTGIVSAITRAPYWLVLVATLAIPVIHVQAAGGHNDNLCNLPFAAGALAAIVIAMGATRRPVVLFAIATFMFAFASNVKLTFVPLSMMALALTTIAIAIVYLRNLSAGQIRAAVLVGLLGGLAIGYKPLYSMVHFGNPLYPLSFEVLGLQGPLTMATYKDPAYLNGYPQAIKWLLSVFEYHAFDYRPLLYTVAQGDVAVDAPSFRMGGYLASYVIAITAILCFLLVQLRKGWVIISSTIVLLTLFVAVMPASQELRYYSFWFALIIYLAMLLCWRFGLGLHWRKPISIVATASLLFVSSATGLTYLTVQGYSLHALAASFNFEEQYAASLKPGGSYCLLGFQKFGILAAPFARGSSDAYRIVVAHDIGDCHGAEVIRFR